MVRARAQAVGREAARPRGRETARPRGLPFRKVPRHSRTRGLTGEVFHRGRCAIQRAAVDPARLVFETQSVLRVLSESGPGCRRRDRNYRGVGRPTPRPSRVRLWRSSLTTFAGAAAVGPRPGSPRPLPRRARVPPVAPRRNAHGRRSAPSPGGESCPTPDPPRPRPGPPRRRCAPPTPTSPACVICRPPPAERGWPGPAVTTRPSSASSADRRPPPPPLHLSFPTSSPTPTITGCRTIDATPLRPVGVRH